MRILARLLLLSIALLAGSAARAQTGAGPLWEVTSPTNTVYLLGTIHVGSQDLYPLSPAIEHAYADARVLALEADPTDATALLAAMGAAAYTPPDDLSQHIPQALLKRVETALTQRGLPAQMALSLKPFMLSLMLTMAEIERAGFQSALGIDLYLAGRAHQDGKTLIELESMAQQIDLLAGLPDAVQAAMLESALNSLETGSLAGDMKAMVTAWRRGDLAQLEQLSTRDIRDMPAGAARLLQQKLYDERNRAMAGQIAAMLAGRDVTLVGVGAGHLVGSTGLIALLKARGYTLRRL